MLLLLILNNYFCWLLASAFDLPTSPEIDVISPAHRTDVNLTIKNVAFDFGSTLNSILSGLAGNATSYSLISVEFYSSSMDDPKSDVFTFIGNRVSFSLEPGMDWDFDFGS